MFDAAIDDSHHIGVLEVWIECQHWCVTYEVGMWQQTHNKYAKLEVIKTFHMYWWALLKPDFNEAWKSVRLISNPTYQY